MSRRNSRYPYATIMIFSPAVMSLRWPALIAEAMNHGAPRPETTRAWTEKVVAIAQGTAAAHASIATASVQTAVQMMTGTLDPRRLADVPGVAFDAALHPIAVTVRANHRRLSR